MYSILLFTILVLCEVSMMNVGKMMKDRMMMQNAVDNMTMAAAIHQARMLNALAHLNYQIALTLANGFPMVDFGGLNGKVPYISLLSVGGEGEIIGVGGGVYGVCALLPKFINGVGFKNDISGLCSQLDIYPLGLQDCQTGTGNGTSEQKTAISAVPPLLTMLVGAQEGLATAGAATSALIAYNVAKQHDKNLAGDLLGPGSADCVPTGGFGWGLKRNEQEIKWYGAKHTYISLPPVPIVLPPGLHVHIVTAFETDIEPSKKSWYVGDGNTPEEWAVKNIGFTATRGKGHAANKGYPLAGNWLGIDWVDIFVVAKARYLNATGNVGFPVHKCSGKVEDRGLLNGDLAMDPYQAYTADDEPSDWSDDDGLNGSRWYAEMIKTDSYLH